MQGYRADTREVMSRMNHARLPHVPHIRIGDPVDVRVPSTSLRALHVSGERSTG
jgi:hypothetical protein